MTPNKKESLKPRNVPHVINIFNVYNRYRVFKFSCESCKNQEKCIDSFEKKTECLAADKTENWLQPLVVGRCDTFASDDFYVNISNRFRKEKIKKTIETIQKQFGA